MGEVFIDHTEAAIIIQSHFIIYGNAANEELTELIRKETEDMWNEPQGVVTWNRRQFRVRFEITAEFNPSIEEMQVLQNTDPRNNYFRIEEYAIGNISFVDGLGCNSGYFKKENLYPGSTTAAHEYGHTLGLAHPMVLDIRGQGQPGIMYPRGTLVDQQFQYDPLANAGGPGGTMHPMHRRVLQSDIDLLRINRLDFSQSKSIIGDFSNVFHWDHASGS